MKIKNIIVILIIICCTATITKAQIIIVNSFSYDPPNLTLDWGNVSPGGSLSLKKFTVICGEFNSKVNIFCSTCPSNLSCKGGGIQTQVLVLILQAQLKVSLESIYRK